MPWRGKVAQLFRLCVHCVSGVVRFRGLESHHLFYGSESMRNQTRARRTAVVMLILFFASFLPGNACFAGRPLMFLHGRHHAGHGHCDHPGCRAHHRHRVAPSYRETYKYMNWRYPKYTGAFHANYFQTMGVAPGDVGFRGNGVYMTPW